MIILSQNNINALLSPPSCNADLELCLGSQECFNTFVGFNNKVLGQPGCSGPQSWS
jgi:hypothetical protein